jgi:AraC-like DNA-binding protein
MDQYAQLLLVEILRCRLADTTTFPPSWLRALLDERIAPAMRAMHANPESPWHLDELARSASMSRTAFAAHFKAVAGLPPLTYLHHWRIRLAQRALRDGNETIAAIGVSLGYSSESAFSNAFKRTVGVAPGRYRLTCRAANPITGAH